MIVSLSTAWNGKRHGRPFDALREIQALGFEWVELYAHWLPLQVEELKHAVAELGLRVSSLHGPCPVLLAPAGGFSEWRDWLAEIDEPRRRHAVDAHRCTIDLAAELGARAVVVHLGNTGARGLQRQVFEAIRQHGRGSSLHLALVEEARAARRAAEGNGALDAAVRSAVELGEHARGTGVSLGLECRDQFVEIPSLDEYPLLFEACAGLPVSYWHDVGHASKLENAGLLRAADLLGRFGDRLLGTHLHDTVLDWDHRAPGNGDTDFASLAAHLQPETIRTLELSPRYVDVREIGPALEHLRKAGVLS